MKARLTQIGNLNFTARGDSGHEVVMSAAAEAGGEDRGARPMEMVLHGLGGCSGIDVLLILRKGRQQVTALTIDIEAERAATPPRVFTRIHLHYRLHGRALAPAKVARAVSLSVEKYCSVARMLHHAVAITHQFSITETAASA